MMFLLRHSGAGRAWHRCTAYYALHEATDEVRKWLDVPWADEGEEVKVAGLECYESLPARARAALKKLVP